MSDLMKVGPAEMAVQAIIEGEQAKVADGVLVSVQSGFRIATVEDRQQASDTLNLLRRTVRQARDGMTEAFRPMKALEKALRGLVDPKVTAWELGATKVEGEMRRWDAAAERARREAEVVAQKQADLAAQIAREQAALLVDDEEALPSAQVVIPHAENTVKGVVGKDHKTRKARAMGIADAAAVARAHPEWLTLDCAAATREYERWMKLGARDLPPELDPERPLDVQGVVIDGVRYVTTVTYVSGRAS